MNKLYYYKILIKNEESNINKSSKESFYELYFKYKEFFFFIYVKQMKSDFIAYECDNGIFIAKSHFEIESFEDVIREQIIFYKKEIKHRCFRRYLPSHINGGFYYPDLLFCLDYLVNEQYLIFDRKDLKYSIDINNNEKLLIITSYEKLYTYYNIEYIYDISFSDFYKITGINIDLYHISNTEIHYPNEIINKLLRIDYSTLKENKIRPGKTIRSIYRTVIYEEYFMDYIYEGDLNIKN